MDVLRVLSVTTEALRKMPNVRVFYNTPAPDQQTKLNFGLCTQYYQGGDQYRSQPMRIFKKKSKSGAPRRAKASRTRRSLTEQGGSDPNDSLYLFYFFWRQGRFWGVILAQYK
jgi:hypothetical protein